MLALDLADDARHDADAEHLELRKLCGAVAQKLVAVSRMETVGSGPTK